SACQRAGFGGELELANAAEYMLHPLRVAAGEDKLNDMAADLRSEDVPVQLRGRGKVIKADEGAIGDGDGSGGSLDLVVGTEMRPCEIDELQSRGCRRKGKE